MQTILGADLGQSYNGRFLGNHALAADLAQEGLEVSTLEYFKLGIIVVPVMIVVGSLLIWLKL